MNVEYAQGILKQLAKASVQCIALCPGGRNAPFVSLLAKSLGFEVCSFFDERSASFFALGRARRDRRPTVVLTTSGTAVSELHSAVIEAFYSNTPLVVVSADRPKRLRGSGAPQVIEQSEIFSPYVHRQWDLEVGDSFELDDLPAGPCHLNVCFDEPLIDLPVSNFDVTSFNQANKWCPEAVADPLPTKTLERALIIVGHLPVEARRPVEKALAELKVPLFCEAMSGLRGSQLLTEQQLRGGSGVVSEMLNSGQVQSVVRVGDVPLGRFWRDLDFLKIPTINLNDKKWLGQERGSLYRVKWSDFDLSPLKILEWDFSLWMERDLKKRELLKSLLNEYPLSEVGYFRFLHQQIAEDEPLYLGNSLPIRLWDMVSGSGHSLFANRGANGIDGQISTALGLAHEDKKLSVILGDLTTLYDSNGLWVTPMLKSQKISVNLMVINNGGGQIFKRIFDEPLFCNQHQVSFQPLAQTWGWNYHQMNQSLKDLPSEGLNLIEINPDVQQSEFFWQRFDQS